MPQLCFFEDEQCAHFKPLTLTRPTDHLRVGINRIFEKWTKSITPEQVTRILRHELLGIYPNPEPNPEISCLWINSRFLPDSSLTEQINQLKIGEGLTFKDVPVVRLLDGTASKNLFHTFHEVPSTIHHKEVNRGFLLERLTDILHINGDQIIRDIELRDVRKRLVPTDSFTIHGKHPVYIEKDIIIEPGVMFLTNDGPIYLGEGAHIMSGAMLRGPLAICEHSTVKMGAKLYTNSTIGPYSKVGGELNNVIIQGYSNKGHDGFLGNSILGEWCNLGADTNNSNLKNNYSSVRLADWQTGEMYDTGLQFCGMIMADHCKTAINTMINTGSIFGVNCNIVSGNFPPKHLPSFSWYTPNEITIYNFDKAIHTAEKMMERRGITVDEPYRKMMKYLFDNR